MRSEWAGFSHIPDSTLDTPIANFEASGGNINPRPIGLGSQSTSDMGSAICGISGFVDGFLNGRTIRNSWEDRKKDRARQEMLDARDTKTHVARMDEYGRRKIDWQLARDEKERIRRASQVFSAMGRRLIPPQHRYLFPWVCRKIRWSYQWLQRVAR